MTPYPMFFRPILKPKVWGGRSLAALGKDLPEGVAIGESWELADLPEDIPQGRSIIANGELAGRTLREALAKHRKEIMGDGRLTAEGGFPLLIKFLDAQENLSVQVHPNEAYVAKHPQAHLKSEAWVIVQAEPDAVIYKGVRPGVTAEQFAEHIRAGEAVADLIAVPVKPGDCHYLPSGTCHALGAGIVVAEIQTPSDTTFRVYDWGRAGTGRELHIEQALQCIRFGNQATPAAHYPQPHRPFIVGGICTTQLVVTEHFEIERIDALARVKLPIVTSGVPEVWMMIAGTGKIETQRGHLVDLHPGTTVLNPAALEDGWALLERHAWLLRIMLPSSLKGMIA